MPKAPVPDIAVLCRGRQIFLPTLPIAYQLFIIDVQRDVRAHSVFGGIGTLGSHIIDALHVDDSFSLIITIEALLDDIQPQTIISCAASKPTARKAIQYQTNYVGTKSLLECARRHPAIQALVYTSSAQALSNVYDNGPLKEEDAILHDLKSDAPAYHRTKGIADALVLAANIPNPISTSSAGFLKTAVLRVPALYGPRDGQVSSALIAKANTIVTRVQFGDGKARHEWLYLESAALAHVLAAKALLDGRKGIDGEAFFVTDGEPLRFWAFARLMWRTAGDMHCSDSRIVVLPMRVVLVISMLIEWLVFVCTLGKARDRLRYVPVCTTEEGVRRTVEWFTKENDRNM